jgi:hypothetical protein
VARLEDLTRGAAIRGILPGGLVTVVDVHWYGTSAIELTYKDAAGRPGNQLLYHNDEARLEVVSAGRPWSFDADGGLLRLVSEAQRIRLAYLFDPFLAVHTSLIEPLPHQITGVVEVPPAEEFPEGDAFAIRDERAIYGAPPGGVVRYVRRPFTREPDFGATSVNYDWRELWQSGTTGAVRRMMRHACRGHPSVRRRRGRSRCAFELWCAPLRHG